jgi:hypothetical protein
MRVERAFHLPEELHEEWVECDACFGEGFLPSCTEASCVCAEPPCRYVICELCDGRGGWHPDEPDDDDVTLH